jgi:hypothetical protein
LPGNAESFTSLKFKYAEWHRNLLPDDSLLRDV